MSRTCNECGKPVSSLRVDAEFCATPCRMTFHNRRARRGVEIYDMFMAMRYQRKWSKIQGIWAFACRLAMHWRDEDIAQREGRHSWQNPKKIIEKKPYLRNM